MGVGEPLGVAHDREDGLCHHDTRYDLCHRDSDIAVAHLRDDTPPGRLYLWCRAVVVFRECVPHILLAAATPHT